MATRVTFQPDRVGDWGVATAVDGRRYETGEMKMRDGVAIFYRAWLHPDAQRPILLIMHGLGAHSGWFIDGIMISKRTMPISLCLFNNANASFMSDAEIVLNSFARSTADNAKIFLLSSSTMSIVLPMQSRF